VHGTRGRQGATGETPSDRPKVRFVLGRADGRNGVARSVLTTAACLTPTYDVEVIGLFRRRRRFVYPVPPGVTTAFLQDLRADAPESWLRERLSRRRSRLLDPDDPPRLDDSSLLTDLLLLRRVRAMRSGVLVTTRPELHVFAARFAPPGLALVAQEHMNYPQRPDAVRRRVAAHAGRLDAMVVLTERDAHDYRADARWPVEKLHCIPNSMPWRVEGTYEPHRKQVVIAAGRLDHQKGFDRLVEAYRPLVDRHPGWELHIYGEGRQRPALQASVREAGLEGHVQLKGWTDHMGDALADASVFALSSRYEGLPLAGIEALSKGLPLVAFDCPRGPRELVRDGENGRLVPDGDVAAFTEALDEVMRDDDRRVAMGRRSWQAAQRFDISTVGAAWDDLFRDLLRARGHATPP
jgi:glycosyltransferase involved in cell wall biosynthesis